MAAFLVNQLGSALFIAVLASDSSTVAHPLTNVLTFVVTAVTASVLGERSWRAGTAVGIALIALGMYLILSADRGAFEAPGSDRVAGSPTLPAAGVS